MNSDNQEVVGNPNLPHGIHTSNGQAPGGHGRRVLVPESGAAATPNGGVPSQKASQKVLLAKEMTAAQENRDATDHLIVGQKRGSQVMGSGVGSNSNSVKRSMVLQNP